MGEPTVNLLEGTVCCSVNYTRTETRWYKTEEDANAGRNGSYNHDDYVIAREKAYKDSTSVTFDIRDRFFFLFTKISEYYLDSNSASRKLIKLSNHGTDCFSQPAHRSRIYVGCSQLWHCSTSLHLSGAAQAAERRQGHGRRPCTHGCCSRYVGRCNQERALSPFFNSFLLWMTELNVLQMK